MIEDPTLQQEYVTVFDLYNDIEKWLVIYKRKWHYSLSKKFRTEIKMLIFYTIIVRKKIAIFATAE